MQALRKHLPCPSRRDNIKRGFDCPRDDGGVEASGSLHYVVFICSEYFGLAIKLQRLQQGPVIGGNPWKTQRSNDVPNYCGTKKTLGGPGFRSRSGANWAGISPLALQKTIVNCIVNGFAKANKSPDLGFHAPTHAHAGLKYRRAGALPRRRARRHWRHLPHSDGRPTNSSASCPLPQLKCWAALTPEFPGAEYLPLDDAATGSTIAYMC